MHFEKNIITFVNNPSLHFAYLGFVISSKQSVYVDPCSLRDPVMVTVSKKMSFWGMLLILMLTNNQMCKNS